MSRLSVTEVVIALNCNHVNQNKTKQRKKENKPNEKKTHIPVHVGM